VAALGLVPARGGSTRLPRKNLAVLGGKTLVRRALETAIASERFDVVALSSDDEEILAEAEGLDVVCIARPPELATTSARSYDVVVHALGELSGDLDVVAVLQATSPFTAPADVAGTVDLLTATGAESAVSVVRVEAAHHPLKLKVMDGDRLLPWLAEDELTPSQELPPLWVRNGSVYVSRREVIRRGELLSLRDCRGYEMPAERSFDIDTPRDLAFAEFLVARGDAKLT
jgi:CMP-N-acetylneuraminic acid synthetase